MPSKKTMQRKRSKARKQAAKKLTPTPVEKCSICLENFCDDCDCLRAKKVLPCPCDNPTCYECYVKHVMNTAVSCTRPNCQCGKKMFQCPVCRVGCQVCHHEFNWVRNTFVDNKLWM